jgi:bicarbonate transport system substrate-binding protein
MPNESGFTRRRFLATAGASAAGAFFLKGCSQGATLAVAQMPPARIAPNDTPETTKAVLGYLPIVESAPLIIAKEKGFFARYGMTEVKVAKQSNWAGARDNVTIGSAAGGIDGGQWQMPMPYLISEGIITLNNQKVPMSILAQLNTQGNGIAVSKTLVNKGIGLKIDNPDFIKGFAATNGRKFKAAYTFPKANQDFWIRYWFAANGIDPDQDVELLSVPPAETMQGLRNGSMDAFTTGDPWPYRIIGDEIGYLAALTGDIWKYHPEEYFAMREDWVEKNPKATRAILMSLMEAQQWCDKPENRAELIDICAQRQYYNVYKRVLTTPYAGKYEIGDTQKATNDFNSSPLYWKDGNGVSISYPFKSHDLWFITESMRWGFYKKELFTDFDVAKKLIDRVNREDLWREAANAAGLSADAPTGTSRGIETFFDGAKFDPANPQQYLNSLKIKAA